MTTEEIDDAIHEFGHAVAADVRRLPWFKERWPTNETDGFDLFHEIVKVADSQLERLLPILRQPSN